MTRVLAPPTSTHRRPSLSRARVSASLAAVLALAFVLAACSQKPATPVTPPASTSGAGTPAAETSYANPDLLVETIWLADHLDDADLRIVDARPAKDYVAGHVKGAVNIPVEDTFNPVGPKGMAAPEEAIVKLLSQKGIGNDTRVVVYDGGRETLAPRIFWTLEYYGHAKVSYLNGGFSKWKKEDRPVSTEVPEVQPATFEAKVRDEVLSTKEKILARIGKPQVALVDARSPEEYDGRDLRAKRGGHIPGAVNIDWRTLFTAGDTPVLKPSAELAKMYLDAGVTRDKEVHGY